MRTRSKALIGIAVGVVALGVAVAFAGPVFYRDVIVGPAAEAPRLSDVEPLTAAPDPDRLDPADLSGEWQISEGSTAGYRVNEVLNGTEVTVTGRTKNVTGTLTVNDLTLASAEFTVDVASITTDREQRDSYFRQNALRTDEFPTATFVLTEPVGAAAAPNTGEKLEQRITGDLTIAGVTRSVTFVVQLRTDGKTVEIAGQIPITFTDFGVETPNLGFVSVEQTGFVEFELVAARLSGP